MNGVTGLALWPTSLNKCKFKYKCLYSATQKFQPTARFDCTNDNLAQAITLPSRPSPYRTQPRLLDVNGPSPIIKLFSCRANRANLSPVCIARRLLYTSALTPNPSVVGIDFPLCLYLGFFSLLSSAHFSLSLFLVLFPQCFSPVC